MSVQIDPAELEHTRATVVLSFEGLFITHFDPSAKTWEIDFLRNSHHTFAMSIMGNGVNTQQTIGSVPNIRITTVGGIAPDFGQFPNGYWFSNQIFSRPADLGHPEDFGWVPDLANLWEFPLHGRVSRRSTLGSRIDSNTMLSVANVILYTRSRTDYPLRQAVSNIPSPFIFGRTNKAIGADILCEDGGEVVIEIDGSAPIHLPRVSGSPYVIEFENSDNRRLVTPPDQFIQDQFMIADFSLFYEFVDVSGIEYDMLCEKRLIVSGDCDCNGGNVSRFEQ